MDRLSRATNHQPNAYQKNFWELVKRQKSNMTTFAYDLVHMPKEENVEVSILPLCNLEQQVGSAGYRFVVCNPNCSMTDDI